MSFRELVLLLVLAALWGGSFLFMRIAVPEFGPVPLIAIRVAVAAASLSVFVLTKPALRRELLQNLRPLALLALFNAALPFPLFAYATLHVTVGFASVLNATAPLFAAIVAWLWMRDPVTVSGVLGLLIGFGGVAVLTGGTPADWSEGTARAVAAGLGGSLLYGISASFVKRRLAGIDAWVTTAGSMALAAVMLAPVAFLQWPASPPGPLAWSAVILLAIACTSIPSIFYFRLVVSAGPTRAMAVAFLIPGFAMLWGWLALSEPITLRMLAGCAVVLAGTALATGFAQRWLRLVKA